MLLIDGNAGARCGISMKGVDILVKPTPALPLTTTLARLFMPAQ
jgi:glutamate synthase domain-containing protein 3